MKVCLQTFAKCAFLTVGLMVLVTVGNMKEAAAAIEGVFEYETFSDGNDARLNSGHRESRMRQ